MNHSKENNKLYDLCDKTFSTAQCSDFFKKDSYRAETLFM